MTVIKDSWVQKHSHKDGSVSYTAHIKVKAFLFFTITKNVCSIGYTDGKISYVLFDSDSIFGDAHHFKTEEEARKVLDYEVKCIEAENKKESDGKIVRSERI